jgi:NADH pyrophosphatase NudC (nudix superfamily)
MTKEQEKYAAIKADPVKYAVYLERKRRERAARPLYETARHRKWRLAHQATNELLHKANYAVAHAITEGLLVRAKFCSRCGSTEEIQAHHRSYEPEHWLVVEWLCQKVCHPRADKERE